MTVRGSVLVALLAAIASLALVDRAAAAATPSAAWNLAALAYPSNFRAADNAACTAQPVTEAFEACDTELITVTNVGSVGTKGTITLTDEVSPASHVTVRAVALFGDNIPGHESQNLADLEAGGKEVCTTAPLKCELTEFVLTQAFGTKGALEPDQALKIYVSVLVNQPGPLTNKLTVSGGIKKSKGGGGPPSEVTLERSNTVESLTPPFGINLFDAPLLGVDGQPETQAGAHPYELHTRLGLNNTIREDPEAAITSDSVQDVRDVYVDLPAGLAGSAVMAPTCTLARLASKGAKGEQGHSGCPANTIVGHIRTFPESGGAALGPIYNLVPEKGAAAELGFIDATGSTHVLTVTLAPTPAGYVVRTSSKEIPQIRLFEVLVNVFGDPAARDNSSEEQVPTFTNPEHCDGEPLITTMHLDSWQAPGRYNADGTPDLSDPNWATASYESPPVSNCEALQGHFVPAISAAASTKASDSPAGIDVDLKVPQAVGVEELGTPPVRDTKIVLPQGFVVNPSSANGLAACSLEELGMSASGVPNAAPPHCPDGSKIGTVTVETPSLSMQTCKHGEIPLNECPPAEIEPAPLTGSIYLARQGENPFGSLIAIYIVIDDPRLGILVKVPAEVTPDPVTGQLTAVVTDAPQFPFSLLHTHFFEGDTAALSSPMSCGNYEVGSELTPWSAPQSGPPATPGATIPISEGAGGGTCQQPGFAPTFAAGSSNTKAGGFSPFTVVFSRRDGEQQLAGTSVTTPPGLLGTIRGVPLCREPQAARGDCDASSQLGEATVAVGSGPSPYWVHGGKVYLTGPYDNGPFGLSIVVPTTAGPFTLTGNGGPGREVVRASIRVDPHTAQISVVSDPLPTILEGIPLQVRTVDVAIDRPSFTFNPTNCSRLQSEATLSGLEGAISRSTSQYFASNCTSLKFTPAFTATSQAVTSKRNGASLTIHIAASPGQANIAKTDLQLPIQLPSRQSTLEKACLASVFEANPALCSAESIIGSATVSTPVLNSPLSGPIYLVSFGGAAFPSTEIVLQGEGVTAILNGTTDIKAGITYSRFEAVPDVPFSSFEANLPSGPHSILGAILPEKLNRSLCGTRYEIPTLLVAQNGLQIRQATPIRIEGCPHRPTVRSASINKRRHTLTLTIYTPQAGTLGISGKGVRGVIVHTSREHNQTIVLRTTSAVSRGTILTLRQITSHQAPQTTRVSLATVIE